MSMAEEMYGSYDVPNYAHNEEHWKEGVHYNKGDRKYLISEMEDGHLMATIRYFEGSDTRPLAREAKKRGLIKRMRV